MSHLRRNSIGRLESKGKGKDSARSISSQV